MEKKITKQYRFPFETKQEFLYFIEIHPKTISDYLTPIYQELQQVDT